MLASVDRSAIYLEELISNLIFFFGIEFINLLVFSVFFNIDIFRLLPGPGAENRFDMSKANMERIVGMGSEADHNAVLLSAFKTGETWNN